MLKRGQECDQDIYISLVCMYICLLCSFYGGLRKLVYLSQIDFQQKKDLDSLKKVLERCKCELVEMAKVTHSALFDLNEGLS